MSENGMQDHLSGHGMRCRCYNKHTGALVAIKSMPISHRKGYNYLFDIELNALISTNGWQVPRVIRLLDQGTSAIMDRCLVFKYDPPFTVTAAVYRPN